MKLTELYWAAGFLEGEGCFHVGGRTVITMAQKRRAAITRAVLEWRQAPGNPKTWLARGYCKNGHALTGANYVVAPSGHGRCRQCGIESRRRYYAKHKGKWRDYASQRNVIPFKKKEAS